MAKKGFNFKIVRNFGLGLAVAAPFAGYWYVSSKMKIMEQGIHDDLKRIKEKGKTLADIPRKE